MTDHPQPEEERPEPSSGLGGFVMPELRDLWDRLPSFAKFLLVVVGTVLVLFVLGRNNVHL